jgi:beta-catenin-like protein 1
LRALATTPDLYPGLVELRCVASFVGLLSHENTDIVCAVIDLVQELTDVDALHESEEGADALIETLISNQIAALLVQCMDRLNESVREESDGVHNALSIFENIVELRPAICKDASEVGLLGWLMKKLKVKVPFDNNKLFASEILSIFLQNEPENRAKYGEMGSAIDSLLQQLAYYKRHNPNTAEEMEMMENLFNCLCSLLLHTPNREKFLRGEGLQLMNLMLREKKESRNGALKVLDHALTGPEGKDNCAKFVDILGLRTIFPLFMKTPKRSKRKGVSAEEHEEHVIAIVASLMKNCKGAQRQRLVSKFTESDHEKVGIES